MPFTFIPPHGIPASAIVVEDDRAFDEFGLIINRYGRRTVVTNLSGFRVALTSRPNAAAAGIPIAVTRRLRTGDVIKLDDIAYRYRRTRPPLPPNT